MLVDDQDNSSNYFCDASSRKMDSFAIVLFDHQHQGPICHSIGGFHNAVDDLCIGCPKENASPHGIVHSRFDKGWRRGCGYGLDSKCTRWLLWGQNVFVFHGFSSPIVYMPIPFRT